MSLIPERIRDATAGENPFKLADGKGMYLLVNATGRYWRMDYRFEGKRKTLALGVIDVAHVKPRDMLAKLRQALNAAREAAAKARKLIADGIDPGQTRKDGKAARRLAVATTFEAIAREWLAIRKKEWMPSHYVKEVLRLEVHAFPWIGGKPIADLVVSDIRPLLERAVDAGHLETAHRLRYECSRIFDYSAATERSTNNPARALKAILPAHRKKRFPTITDPAQVGELLRAMNGFGGTFPVACALRLAPLWFCRPGEIRAAKWSYFDLDGAEPTYRVPPMNRKLRKAEKENPNTEPHYIPLSVQALEILRELKSLTRHGEYLFPGARDPKRCMSEAAINAALASMGYKGILVGHGFRHLASTLLREIGWPKDVVEAQLSHKVAGVEGVYNMAQYLPQRRKMMQAWADYLDVLREDRKVVAGNFGRAA